VTIAVHFKNAFRGADQNLASVDGIWQISDTPAEVKADTNYDKMTITGIDATTGVITMNNKDEPVTLTKNKDTVLMPGVNIKTADNDTLRFYIYKPVTVDGAAEAPAAMTAEAKPAVEAPAAEAAVATVKAAVENKTAEAKPAAEAAVATAKAAVENKTAAAAGAAKEAAPAASNPMPGFESIFAIAGLLAVAYLVIGRKE
jgi:hypothetical protein